MQQPYTYITYTWAIDCDEYAATMLIVSEINTELGFTSFFISMYESIVCMHFCKWCVCMCLYVTTVVLLMLFCVGAVTLFTSNDKKKTINTLALPMYNIFSGA